MIILYGLTAALSLYGNCMVLKIANSKKLLQNVNNYLIINLAISDIIIALVCTPFNFHAALVQRWDLPIYMCKLLPTVQG